ncbi:peptide deformylase [uncultured Polaribacter sp.]|jgi:peptide deformylase|uniref:peptide deformylase n=1 Tax=uncultured Polaribacter sp. TaxID=174711 RepID=UPI00260F0178|nr:peptide deformylase [uncultured Polaribacter sp.]
MVKNLNRILILVLLIVSVVGCKSSYRFTKNQKSLIKMGDSATPMRVLKITNSSDSILLRTKSSKIKIDPNDEILKTFINRLYSTVRDSMSLGVGIAAPQVGVLKKIIWVQRFDKEKFPFEVYLNPEIVEYSYKKQPCLEGCLSIPKRRDTTYTRSETIMIEYDQFNKKRTREKISGFTAVIFQHEIDHLNGILYLDHLEKEKNQQEN